MIHEEESFQSTKLDEVRLDLEPVFVVLNQCWSLCLLGDIPNNIINKEVRRIVIELGNLALLFKGEESRRGIIKQCF